MLEDRKLGLFERIWQLFTGKNKTESSLRSLVKELSDSKSGLSEANKELKSEVGHKRIENKEIRDQIDSGNRLIGEQKKEVDMLKEQRDAYECRYNKALDDLGSKTEAFIEKTTEAKHLQGICDGKDVSIEKLGESLDAYRNDAVAKNKRIDELVSAKDQDAESIECLEFQIIGHKENQRQARRKATLAENRADRYERSHKVLEHLEKLGKYDPLVDEPEDLFEKDEGEPTTADEFNESFQEGMISSEECQGETDAEESETDEVNTEEDLDLPF